MKQQTPNTALVADNSQATGFSMADLMAQFDMPSAPTRNSIVTGEVVACVKGGYLVSLGMKSDSLVKDAEPGELEIGKSYQFYVNDDTDGEGEAELSYRRAATWTRLAALTTSREVVMAQVHRDPRRAISRSSEGDRVGGLVAFVDGIRSFIPRRETPQYCRLDSLVGETIPVVVLSADPAKGRGGSVVLSYNGGLESLRMARLAQIQDGDVLKGKVVKVIESGILVDVGDLTGLCPRGEVGGDRSGDAMRNYSVGQEVEVKVTGRKLETGKISFSIRGAKQDKFLKTLHEGDTITGVVARFEPYGAFVCLNDCIDGLLHIEDFASNGNRREKLAVGSTIEAQIVTLDPVKGRIGLSRKHLNQ